MTVPEPTLGSQAHLSRLGQTAMTLTAFIVDTLGLTKLPPHLPTLVCSFLCFLLVHQVLAPWASKKWFPVAYGSKSRRAKNNWSIHVVSQVHTVVIVPLGLWILATESRSRTEDRAFGWDDDTGFVHAIACGYFLWDSLDAIVNFIDPGFVVHGIACLAIYVMSYKPFVAYYGTRCLLWETSTFFLNVHWFLDKTNRTGSTLQLINGFLLLASFFGVRIVYGGMVSYQFFHTLFVTKDKLSLPYILVYGVGNVILVGLNWLWFSKMISALNKRFSSKNGRDRRKLPRVDETSVLASGIDHRVNGTTNGYGAT